MSGATETPQRPPRRPRRRIAGARASNEAIERRLKASLRRAIGAAEPSARRHDGGSETESSDDEPAHAPRAATDGRHRASELLDALSDDAESHISDSSDDVAVPFTVGVARSHVSTIASSIAAHADSIDAAARSGRRDVRSMTRSAARELERETVVQTAEMKARIGELKDEFRARLRALEEQFAAEAEALSEQLTRRVEAERLRCEEALRARAEDVVRGVEAAPPRATERGPFSARPFAVRASTDSPGARPARGPPPAAAAAVHAPHRQRHSASGRARTDVPLAPTRWVSPAPFLP